MELPKIFKNNVDLRIDNQVSFRNSDSTDDLDFNLLNKLPKRVYIETKDRKLNVWIIGKTDKHLITDKKEVLNTQDIVKLKEAKF